MKLSEPNIQTPVQIYSHFQVQTLICKKRETNFKRTIA